MISFFITVANTTFDFSVPGEGLYGFTALRLYGFTALRLYGETIEHGVGDVKGVCRIAVYPNSRIGKAGGSLRESLALRHRLQEILVAVGLREPFQKQLHGLHRRQ